MQMVIPLMRRFKHMTECHEFGVAMFDVTKADVQNYFTSGGEELTPTQKRRINTVYANVRKEGEIMQNMLTPVAHAYMALLIAHNGAKDTGKLVAHTETVSALSTSSQSLRWGIK